MSEFFLEDFQDEMRKPEVMKLWDALVDVFILSTGIKANVRVLTNGDDALWLMDEVTDTLEDLVND